MKARLGSLCATRLAFVRQWSMETSMKSLHKRKHHTLFRTHLKRTLGVLRPLRIQESVQVNCQLLKPMVSCIPNGLMGLLSLYRNLWAVATRPLQLERGDQLVSWVWALALSFSTTSVVCEEQAQDISSVLGEVSTTLLEQHLFYRLVPKGMEEERPVMGLVAPQPPCE